MIEIKCSKAQFERIMKNLTEAGCLVDGKCVLGKGLYTCYSTLGKVTSCTECLRKHIKHTKGGAE